MGKKLENRLLAIGVTGIIIGFGAGFYGVYKASFPDKLKYSVNSPVARYHDSIKEMSRLDNLNIGKIVKSGLNIQNIGMEYNQLLKETNELKSNKEVKEFLDKKKDYIENNLRLLREGVISAYFFALAFGIPGLFLKVRRQQKEIYKKEGQMRLHHA
ncbi:hypothetical protein HYX17_01040 [Candidatus Woesearchaeota archaeon]|nr:hypothetical protein [Candidatus Woesearchaeota archaeon]